VDLFFLATLARGMSSVQVASFLGRNESVEEEAAKLRRSDIEIASRGGIS
jgi:hypothetical protein